MKFSHGFLTLLLTVTAPFVASAQSRYFVVQNVASERTRVYERCTTSQDCPHRLIMDTKMLVGMPADKSSREDTYQLRTWLGEYRIDAWKKFYQDQKGKYPSWYKEGYPKLPRKGATLLEWISPRLVMDKKTEDMRGAFGWYAALIGPNANGQWIHGTFGWGADEATMLQKLYSDGGHGGYMNFSSGCTRLENRAIAYLQDSLPVGTEIYRVYSQEGLRDAKLSNYQNQKNGAIWSFTLTKETQNLSSETSKVQSRGVPGDMILEQGIYKVPQFPVAFATMGPNPEQRRLDGYTGNIYNLKKEEFRGVFLVDEGRFINYEHPTSLTLGGSKKGLPADLKTQGGYTFGKGNYRYRN